jgi:dephospho-CoA kinase
VSDGQLRIGITGPIGCGKSTVAGWLAELGAVVIDADQVAREVVEPGTPGFDQVVASFGRDVLREDGSLDRGALGRIVFADPAALARLEAIVHPLVRPAILERLAKADASRAAAVVVEAIKLVEGGLAELCDEVWLVTCDPSAQRQRLEGRGMRPDEADLRIRAQGDIAERVRSSAARVISTSGSVAETRQRVEAAFRHALEDHWARRASDL